jgi:hypothetical protein
MAISPEIKPRINVTADSEYDLAPRRNADTSYKQDKSDNSSYSGIFLALTAIALILAGYVVYQYYYAPTSVTPTITNQSTTPVAPPVVPATPATPPATTTTP